MFADMFFFTYQCWASMTQLLCCGGWAYCFKVTDGGYLRFIVHGTGLQVKNFYEPGLTSLDFLTGVPNIYCTVFPVQVIWYISCGCETFRNGEFTNNIRFWVIDFKVSGCDGGHTQIHY